MNIVVFVCLFFHLKAYFNSIQGDAPSSSQKSFQDPATPVMESIITLHDYLWTFLIFIFVFVSWMLFRTCFLFNEKSSKPVYPVVANVRLEIIWTTLPAVVLTLIGANSISHLYSAEEILFPIMDVIVIGNQWYWTYEFMVFTKKISVESHMVETNDLLLGECRNLEVDNPLVLPIETTVRVLVTSSDVLHSWTVPSLGLKLDAVPGRMNEGSIYLKRAGTFYGQCSEICGKGHSVMPIVVLGVTKEKYEIYLHMMYYRSKRVR